MLGHAAETTLQDFVALCLQKSPGLDKYNFLLVSVRRIRLSSDSASGRDDVGGCSRGRPVGAEESRCALRVTLATVHLAHYSVTTVFIYFQSLATLPTVRRGFLTCSSPLDDTSIGIYSSKLSAPGNQEVSVQLRPRTRRIYNILPS